MSRSGYRRPAYLETRVEDVESRLTRAEAASIQRERAESAERERDEARAEFTAALNSIHHILDANGVGQRITLAARLMRLIEQRDFAVRERDDARRERDAVYDDPLRVWSNARRRTIEELAREAEGGFWYAARPIDRQEDRQWLRDWLRSKLDTEPDEQPTPDTQSEKDDTALRDALRRTQDAVCEQLAKATSDGIELGMQINGVDADEVKRAIKAAREEGRREGAETMQGRCVDALSEWRRAHGKELCPGTNADTFGDGMRVAKERIASIIHAMPLLPAQPGDTPKLTQPPHQWPTDGFGGPCQRCGIWPAAAREGAACITPEDEGDHEVMGEKPCAECSGQGRWMELVGWDHLGEAIGEENWCSACDATGYEPEPQPDPRESEGDHGGRTPEGSDQS